MQGLSKDIRHINDQMVVASMTERRGEMVSKRLTNNFALFAMEPEPSE